MYIIVAGAGELGLNIAQALIDEKHDVGIIDNDPTAIERAEASLDALIIHGNPASLNVLKKTNIDEADLFIATTDSDETNLVGCGVAHSKGCRTIAILRNEEYLDNPISTEKFRYLGVNVCISPELVTAIKIARVASMSSTLDADVFAGGRVRLIEASVSPESQLSGKTLRDANLPRGCNIVAIHRNSDIIIPRGSDILSAGDRVVLISSFHAIIPKIETLFGSRYHPPNHKPMKYVMIVGATRIGRTLAKLFYRNNVKVTLIEESKDVCKKVIGELPTGILVVHGSGTDHKLLVDEDVNEADAFIAVTNCEELNVLSCMVAKQHGVKRVVALVKQPELKTMFQELELGLSVCPVISTTSTILKHVYEPKLRTLYLLYNGEAKAVEFELTENTKLIGKQLKKLKLPHETIIGAIVRGAEVIIPRGDDELRSGDRAIIFTRTGLLNELSKLFDAYSQRGSREHLRNHSRSLI